MREEQEIDWLMDRAEKAAIASERERCAKIASDAQYEDGLGPQESAWNAACQHIAEVIRANG